MYWDTKHWRKCLVRICRKRSIVFYDLVFRFARSISLSRVVMVFGVWFGYNVSSCSANPKEANCFRDGSFVPFDVMNKKIVIPIYTQVISFKQNLARIFSKVAFGGIQSIITGGFSINQTVKFFSNLKFTFFSLMVQRIHVIQNTLFLKKIMKT